MRRRSLVFSSVSVTVLGVVTPRTALTQTGFGSQPIKIIVATPAGGASDTAARLLAQSLAGSLGQSVLVENKPGGNGVPAVQAALSAPPDGHTLLWAMASMAGMPLLLKASPIRSMGEFAPVTTVVDLLYGLFVNPKVPANSVDELTAHLRANPDQLTYGTAVLSEYMVAAQFLRAAGLKALRVPYKGGAQLMPDLISGELQFYIGPLAPALGHVRSGKLRLLATLPERSDIVPDVPSLAEGGLSINTLVAWNGLVAPPRTPSEVTARLAQEVQRALAEPTLRSALQAQGFRVAGGTPQQMGLAIESASATWQQFVRDYEIVQE